MPSGATEYSILDYGCGYGALIDVLAERGRTFRYTGYDVSEEMILRARRLHPGNPCEFTTNEEELGPSHYVVASSRFSLDGDLEEDPDWLGLFH